ncbi:TonB-dependent receptor [Pontibacter sp. G13]|uniref:TonB-dependent receptor n=1 Tax=Pontibacter sp. G13 TaxID=3074898 RepID=UPI002889AEA2|nr:TonB-dependent receptor [Pontibacter sp. G13]WNJ17297.1 TonB-dependent receptor [Pontibacter sp. G13]
MSKYTFLFMMFLTSVIQGVAQVGTLRGTVTDEENLSLPGAVVRVADMSLGAIADQRGNFTVLNMPVGTIQVEVTYMGYESFTTEVTIIEGQTTVLKAQLKAGVMIGDEVLILGDRLKGQAKALNQQKNQINVTNIVSSDQVGRFPDANIGDAMKRIPGITVSYDQGEARFGVIRGTEPRFNSVTVNGERIPSAEAENRTVQLDLIPSDMIQTIEVNKAVTPDMDADAIGGSVNLVTRAAPNGLRISGTAASGYNFLRDMPTYTGALVVGDRFLDGKLGVIVSGSYFDNNLGSHNAEGEWDEQDGEYFIAEWDVRNYELQRVRRSLSAAFDFSPNANHTITLNGIYNHRDDWENRYRLRYGLEDPDENGMQELEVRRQTKGGLNEDRYKNARLEDQRAMVFSLSGDHLFAGKLELDWSATYSRASEHRPFERYIEWEIEEQMGSVDISNPEAPMINLEVPLTDSDFEFKEITEEEQMTFDQDLNGRIDLRLPLIEEGDYANFLKFGGRLRTKTKNRENNFFEYEAVNGDEFASMDLTTLIDKTIEDYAAGDYRSGNFTDPEFLGSLDLKNSNLFEESDLLEEYKGGNFDASEVITGGYVMLEQSFGPQVDMVAGIRIENTVNTYQGFEIIDNDGDITFAETGDTSSYLNVLPGLHFRYQPATNTVLRLAWTNTIARPNYFDLVPYREIILEDNELNEGNADLKPTTSMNFDLMAEQYFKSVGLVSGGLFFKSIQDFIYVSSQEDYLDPISGNTYDDYNRPENGNSATLFGAEIAFQRQLDFLPGFWKGFGVYANYTYTTSSAELPEAEEKITLPGTANHVVNGSLSYENKKLVLRASLNYSSAYLDPYDLDLTEGLERYYDEVLYIDVNGSYAFTDQLRLFVEANNLTNQPLRYYAGSQERTYQAEFYRARLTAGLKFDF